LDELAAAVAAMAQDLAETKACLLRRESRVSKRT
jgi:hypothetical protein